MLTHSPRAFPWEIEPPVGTCQGTGKRRADARGRHPRQRKCLRKGCRRKYKPRRWNQRYCQDPECKRQVDRWLEARRQAKRRRATKSKPSMPRQKERAASKPSPRSRPFQNQKLRRRVVTRQNLFFCSFMRSAGLSQPACDFSPQPGTLLLSRLSSGGSQCPGSRT